MVQHSKSQNIIPTVLVHGGAGNIGYDTLPVKKYGIKLAARTGYETLMSTGNVVDAVQKAVEYLEFDPNFNAGCGAALTWEGKVEMDAAIMNGYDLNSGCVSVAKDILHPIALARSIMDKTRHSYLAGDGAMAYAKSDGFEILPEGALVTEKAKKALEGFKNNFGNGSGFEKPKTFGSPGTVGAVAIDAYGNVAAATTTGGITSKMPGRIGDSPVLGGGTYADNASGCVSTTGTGESIMRYNVASRILQLTENFGYTAQEATIKILDQMTERFKHEAGVICIDSKGNLGIYFNSRRMPWAYQRDGELHFGVDKGEDEVEIVG
ncbi:isoaspartyl peptidase/L-asparaginase-like [Calliphora vicina]|uniref:isoaspartyl peptidase/L-asparaginase-like n=1 Tax=Calliphora vicina TaxID=7373 RepID=UPI00325ADA9E